MTWLKTYRKGFFWLLGLLIIIIGAKVFENPYKTFVQTIPTGKIFSPRAVFDAVPQILGKLPTTIGLTLMGALFGLVLGLIFAIVKIRRVPVLYRIQALFVSFLRGTPILVQLLLSYYGIPMLLRKINLEFGLDWNIDNVPAAVFVVTAFAFNEAAYASETIRAAIQSVNTGEIEAARSLGMTETQVYRRVIIPNAAVIATPTLINSLIGLTKGTSLAFNAGITEMFYQAQIISGNDYRYFERYVAVSMIYWGISFLLENAGRGVENALAIKNPESQSIQIGGDR
ncbi:MULTISPECIES: amino acid ABC transporter permease [Streptococcus]|uniref:Amino acid ABC transporter permease n=1 Tax=Streptococcus caledonicus TaxID=2614158 RepID=A0ABW0UES2_9STRE|nr:amino acid ABC transporter permease [Streptococcus sp. S784/96/1]